MYAPGTRLPLHVRPTVITCPLTIKLDGSASVVEARILPSSDGGGVEDTNARRPDHPQWGRRLVSRLRKLSEAMTNPEPDDDDFRRASPGTSHPPPGPGDAVHWRRTLLSLLPHPEPGVQNKGFRRAVAPPLQLSLSGVGRRPGEPDHGVQGEVSSPAGTLGILAILISLSLVIFARICPVPPRSTTRRPSRSR